MERQIQMSLGGLSGRVPRNRSRSRKAQWWFGQMRAMVERASDWPAPTEPRRPSINGSSGQQ